MFKILLKQNLLSHTRHTQADKAETQSLSHRLHDFNYIRQEMQIKWGLPTDGHIFQLFAQDLSSWNASLLKVSDIKIW